MGKRNNKNGKKERIAMVAHDNRKKDLILNIDIKLTYLIRNLYFDNLSGKINPHRAYKQSKGYGVDN